MDDAAAALVCRCHQAFNLRDHTAMLDLPSEDVVHDSNQGGREMGREAFGRFLARMDRWYEERPVDPAVMTTADGARASELLIAGHHLVFHEGFPSHS